MMKIHERIKEEDLCDMKYINDNTEFSIFDIRDALNEADDMLSLIHI